MTEGAERFAGLSGKLYPVTDEEALLFLASRLTSPPEDDARLLSLVARPLRWDIVLSLCDRHGVTGLVRHRLMQVGAWERLPAPQARAMDRWQLQRRAMHATINRQLDELLGACAQAGIVPVALKGAALAATVYPDPALRSMADIDLLVPVEDMPRLGEMMARLGYQRQGLYYTDEFNASHGYHLIFRHSTQRFRPIEVHWELASRPERRNRLTAAILLARAIPGTQVRAASTAPEWLGHAHVLAPEAQVVYLASHVASEGHAFGRLIWLVDLAATIEAAPALCWPAVTALARRVRLGWATSIALALASHLLGAATPREASAARWPMEPARGILDRTLGPMAVLAPVSAERRAAVKYLIVDGPATTARLLRERLFPDPAIMRTYYATDGLAMLGAYVRHAVGVGGGPFRKRAQRGSVD